MKSRFVVLFALAALLLSSCAKEEIQDTSTPKTVEEATALQLQEDLAELDADLASLQRSQETRNFVDMDEFERLMEREQELMDRVLENQGRMTGTIVNVPGDYAHVGDAINNAGLQPGDIIIVKAANYDYNFGEVIVQNISGVRILADDSNGEVIIIGRFRFSNSDNILVRGFTIHPNEFQSDAIWTGGSTLNGMRIVDNYVDFNQYEDPFFGRFSSEGVSMKGDNYFIKGNTFIVDGDDIEYGIFLEGDASLIKGNVCVHTQGPTLSSGILVSGNDNVIRRNDCTAAYEGIRVDGGSSNTMVLQNKCNNNVEYGIFVAGTNTTVNTNMAMNNGTCDIFAIGGGTSAGSTESGNTANCIQGF